jgi:lysylphosphatidylglycerol synthetase-like protein (DUF2156 family)
MPVQAFMYALIVVGASSMLARLRHARRLERQQIKWFAYATVVVISGVILKNVVYPLVLAEVGILLATEGSERRHGARQHIEIAISSLKRVFGLGETLATTLVGLATRIAAKIAASYTYDAFVVNRMLGRSQGCIKELWA